MGEADAGHRVRVCADAHLRAQRRDGTVGRAQGEAGRGRAAAVGIVLYALIRRFLPNGPWEGASFLSARIVNGFYAVECLSAYSFCVFGGVKALLRPKAP